SRLWTRAPDRCCGERISARRSTAVRSAIPWAIGSTCRSCPGCRCSCSRSTNERYHVIPMTRTFALAILLTAGTLAAVAAQQAQPKVVEVEKLADNLFILKGGGGNTAVFVTAAGVTVVDTKIPGWGQPIIDKVKELTGKPITTIINTHTHYDHV